MNILERKYRNFRHSWRAIRFLWRSEFSFQLQVMFGFLVIVVSWFIELSPMEFAIVILAIGVVLSVEAINTAIEELCDHVTPEEHPKVGIVKDLGSGASLLIGSCAIIVGLFIFIPHIVSLLP